MDDAPVPLSEVLITDQLQFRAKRLANLALELKVLREINRQIAEQSDTLVSTLCQYAVAICGADSAGVTILRDPDSEYLNWDAMVGSVASLTGGRSPRHDSPSGVCLAKNAPQLFAFPERHFFWMQPVPTQTEETLILPIYSKERKPVGTIWIAAHDSGRHFDREDVRVMRALGSYVATGVALAEAKQK